MDSSVGDGDEVYKESEHEDYKIGTNFLEVIIKQEALPFSTWSLQENSMEQPKLINRSDNAENSSCASEIRAFHKIDGNYQLNKIIKEELGCIKQEEYDINDDTLCDNVHLNNVPHRCNICLKAVADSGDTKLTCDECTLKSKSNNLFCNMEGVLASDTQTFTENKLLSCNICERKFKHESVLIIHMKTHPGENRSFSRDKLCKLEVKLNNNVTSAKTKPFNCDFCDYKCSCKSDLVEHIRTHTGEKPYCCSECEYKCSKKSNLVVHMRIHTGEKPFTCDICEYKCSGNSALIRHIRIHTGEKPFACTICDYKTSRKSSLVVHMRIHTGEKPFTCDICEYKCWDKSNFIKHTHIHAQDKPFFCDACEYRCLRKHNLISHKRIHSGEKPFACNICEYRSSFRSTFIRHVQAHTRVKQFSCRICDSKFLNKNKATEHMKMHVKEKSSD